MPRRIPMGRKNRRRTAAGQRDYGRRTVGHWCMERSRRIFDKDTERKGREKNWYRLTGRVSLVKIEPDGDLHIQLVDDGAADGDVNVVVEVPFGDPWCDIRDTVFGWVNHDFPIPTTGGKKFTLDRKPVITVVGKAFYDAIHGQGDTSKNRRRVPDGAAETTKQVTIWEVHPVMRLDEKQ